MRKKQVINNRVPESILNKALHGDAAVMLRELPDNCIDCVVTSPPYFGKRDYNTGIWCGGDPTCNHKPIPAKLAKSTLGGSKKNSGHQLDRAAKCKCGAIRVIDMQIGQEKSPEEYIANLSTVFKEIYRVLKPTGVFWLNIGDTYWGGKGTSGAGGADKDQKRVLKKDTLNRGAYTLGGKGQKRPQDGTHPFIKPKDLIGIPWMAAFAVRDIGFYLRSDIIWSKGNSLPESVVDRCSVQHEYIFMFSKSRYYYFDYVAIQEDAVRAGDVQTFGGKKARDGQAAAGDPRNGKRGDKHSQWGKDMVTGDKRNKRSVWTVPTNPFPGAHFATFPPDLITPMIKAGSSEYGICPHCGLPWERVTKKVHDYDHSGTTGSKYESNSTANRLVKLRQAAREKGEEYSNQVITVGWKPTCECLDNEPVPAVILDPFGGSGTTAMVAKDFLRDFVVIELGNEYISMIEGRLRASQGLFHQSTIPEKTQS